MHSAKPYKVRFGKSARTIEYEGGDGNFILTFDFDVAEFMAKGASKRLFLDPGFGLNADYTLVQCHSQADEKRMRLVKERVKEYLVSLGYEVEQ